MAEPVFFESPAKLRAWLRKHHASERELVVGLWKRDTGKPTLTWPQLVEELLCYGWIDGVRRSLGEEAYTIRITPRKPRSTWSAVNVRLVEKLRAEGRMTPAGEAAFAAREDARTGVYSYEQETLALDAAREKTFRAKKRAWAWWTNVAPPSYRKAAINHVMSAKKDETRDRRLALVMEHAARGERLPQLGGASRRNQAP